MRYSSCFIASGYSTVLNHFSHAKFIYANVGYLICSFTCFRSMTEMFPESSPHAAKPEAAAMSTAVTFEGW